MRLGDDRKLCLLVMIGARPDGTKELVAIEDGYRESTESWADLLRDLKARGMQAPALAVGDGALGFWAAVRDVWPETRHQRDWVHIRTSNVVESPFATTRLRQSITKGPGSRTRGLTMVFKLLTMAQQRWRRLNAREMLPLVREGAEFRDGVRVERNDLEETKHDQQEAA